MMLSTCSGFRHARRSLTMKPAELKHLSTADEEAGIQWICFARIDRIGYSPWWSRQKVRGFEASFFLSMLIARYRDSSSGGGGTKGKSSLPELLSWSKVWLSLSSSSYCWRIECWTFGFFDSVGCSSCFCCSFDLVRIRFISTRTYLWTWSRSSLVQPFSWR